MQRAQRGPQALTDVVRGTATFVGGGLASEPRAEASGRTAVDRLVKYQVKWAPACLSRVPGKAERAPGWRRVLPVAGQGRLTPQLRLEGRPASAVLA
jgi:hypothetical protein